jgi:UrcA family protein
MRLTILAALIAATLPAAAARAGTSAAADVQQVSVKLGELDLGRSEGARAALGRLRQAAQSVCGPTPLPVELAKVSRRRACVEQATEAAVRDLHAPRVTAQYYKVAPARILAAR